MSVLKSENLSCECVERLIRRGFASVFFDELKHICLDLLRFSV